MHRNIQNSYSKTARSNPGKYNISSQIDGGILPKDDGKDQKDEHYVLYSISKKRVKGAFLTENMEKQIMKEGQARPRLQAIKLTQNPKGFNK